MGGGDLNLKKSWHPSTFHNLEKVWKAEQRHESEQKKIAQLQQELQEERGREEMQRTAVEAGVIKQKDDRVDWLYSGPGSSVNREEYLLGRKIDRLVDPTLAEEEREKQALASGPGALFISGDAASSATDLAVKVREDPLFAIRRREEEAKRVLASNPVKMRQLQQLVSKEKHSKKHKTKKKRTHSPDSSRSLEGRKEHRHVRIPSPKRSHDQEKHRKRNTASEDRHRTHHSSSSRYQPYSKPRSHTRCMDPEELRRRREEMMASAREHGKERERKLRRHEEEQQQEEGRGREVGPSQDFLQPLRVQSLTSTRTLEERIHRSIGSVQRTSEQLSAHFLRK